jgi:L-ascorbate metabolism protein UlaG (beta-lactamase superfamily)
MIINPALNIIRHHWAGNPVDKKGRFVNLEFPHIPRFKDVWRWQTGPRPNKLNKKQDKWVPALVQNNAFVKSEDDCIVWLGHAWFFMRLAGVNMLIDPVLFPNRFLKQRVLNPYPPHQLGPIDLILISHDHRDHCDEKSLRRLMKLNPTATIVCGLNMGRLLRRWGHNHIIEMGWYQQFSPINGIELTYMPTRHWSRRLFRDTNHRLWGSFMIKGNDKHIYFGSDSGFGSHYKELSSYFPEIDYAMLGIGAFMPEWFMSPVHTSPTEAVQAFNDTGAKCMIPMHYGMLDLSDEPASLPLKIIRELEEKGEINGKLLVPDIGDTIWI